MIELPPGTTALLFDCDGTLADTMPIHTEAWLQTLLEYGVECPPEFIDAHAGVPTELIVLAANREFGVDLDPAKICEIKEARFEKRLHEVQPIDIVVATARGHFGKLPMAVVSGGEKPAVMKTLEKINVVELFSVVVTASDPVKPKPAPDVFLEAARRLGVEPATCHVFEDADLGIQAARAAGMTVTDVRLELQAK